MSTDYKLPVLASLSLGLAVLLVGVAMVAADRHRVSSYERKEREQLDELRAQGVLVVPRTDRAISVDDPFDAAWDGVPGIDVRVLPQAMTMPVLEDTSLTGLRLQGLTDGRVILWRMSWSDDQPDMNVDADRFCDAVAIQFPLNTGASFMMGGYDQRVQILHWKGIWQKDVDEHFQDVQDLHPNYWTDLYWFATGEAPHRVPVDFEDPRSHPWFVAREAGNPLAEFHRTRAVEELVAEGYGSLSTQEVSITSGRGKWREGTWAVVLERPLGSEDPFDYQFQLGGRGDLAVAVWQGSARNVGGRKHHSEWVPFKVAS